MKAVLHRALPRRVWNRASSSGYSLLASAGARLKQSSWQRAVEDGTIPADVFAGVDDRQWLWLNTAGLRREPALAGLLPGMPDTSVQLEYTGTAGDRIMREAWNFYRLVRDSHDRYSRGARLGRSTDVLDFGCGWGRVIRFFLRDVEPAHLRGIDCDGDAIAICRGTNRWCSFAEVAPLPPSAFDDGSLDVVYAYSVYSHLSEEAHDRWLDEFHRVLRPGGTLVLTTRPRSFIELCAWLRSPEAAGSPASHLVSGGAFLDTAAALARYDAGEYCFSHRGPSDPPHFGETCIPRPYVEANWTSRFELLEFIDDLTTVPQVVTVMRRR
ncbi:MAG: class I SAM-dependent methyltransferase [Acidimicrobiales bacterium]